MNKYYQMKLEVIICADAYSYNVHHKTVLLTEEVYQRFRKALAKCEVNFEKVSDGKTEYLYGELNSMANRLPWIARECNRHMEAWAHCIEFREMETLEDEKGGVWIKADTVWR